MNEQPTQDRIPSEHGGRTLVIAVAAVLGVLFVAWLVSNAVRGNGLPDVTAPDGMVDLDGRAPAPGSPEGESGGMP